MSNVTVALRPAAPSDMALLFEWVNRPDSLANKLRTQAPIALARHRAWFAERLADADSAIWIVERAGEPVGQLRLQRKQAHLEVDIYIVAQARRGRLGEAALLRAAGLAARRWPAVPLLARVKPANRASHRLFLACGYARIADRHDQVVYELRQSAEAGAEP
jgi:RimJ/RimL family protein N-acetyltransferase